MFGGAWALALTIRHGQPMYIMSKFEVGKYLEYTDRYKPTESFLAPPIVTRLLELDPASHSRLASLRFVGVGGAPITCAVMRAFRSVLHRDATLSGVYGATEVGTVCMLRYGEEDITGCVGRPLPGVRIELRQPVTHDGSSSARCEEANAPGEVVISAQSRMMNYRGSIENGGIDVEWYRTGDLGRLENGKLYIVGKAKEIMKVNG
jgi:acyl-CoA synthetase (AMP-forming)/AMP-acid ligase II